ncbi:MAG TPA: hybrid sensor histidine kinase/response regulator [Candidatus Didemnitutus sp.]|jgi:DNA-binding response OmpR family regulator/anti-sigma regulatory factor (Ser/Thr protein kinase)
MTSTPQKRPCLLLVDDTPENISILVELLQGDYDLKVATRGAQALKICEQSPHIDLILLDVMMPEMDGYDVCRQLRAVEATRNTPVIFLTARTDVQDVVRGFDIGANDFVSKPVRIQELLARVRTHLLIRSQQREIEEKNTEMKEMLQMVCHDLANHFAVLNISLELAQTRKDMGMDRLLPPMASAIRNGIGLTNLIRDMRMSEDKGLTLAPVPLRDAVNETLGLVDQRVRDKKLRIVQEVPDVGVIAERVALVNSVLGNVLSNAIKFSHPGGTIEITSQTGDGEIRLGIRDHGIGMPADVLAHLFDFTKSHSRKGTAGEKGTGYGMPLMRKFVALFGGRVEVVSRDVADHPVDHGTEFTIRLKLAPA